ncbi:MAG: hypothetical protein HQ547_05405 [Candidatus Omnitrophica bacterium]|nr:hypothetical protein [Candidatus Omnitrophota bacterium]
MKEALSSEKREDMERIIKMQAPSIWIEDAFGLVVLQGGFVVTLGDSRYPILTTLLIGPCRGLLLYDSVKKIAAFAHIDYDFQEISFTKEMMRKLEEMGAGEDIVFGYTNSLVNYPGMREAIVERIIGQKLRGEIIRLPNQFTFDARTGKINKFEIDDFVLIINLENEARRLFDLRREVRYFGPIDLTPPASSPVSDNSVNPLIINIERIGWWLEDIDPRVRELAKTIQENEIFTSSPINYQNEDRENWLFRMAKIFVMRRFGYEGFTLPEWPYNASSLLRVIIKRIIDKVNNESSGGKIIKVICLDNSLKLPLLLKEKEQFYKEDLLDNLSQKDYVYKIYGFLDSSSSAVNNSDTETTNSVLARYINVSEDNFLMRYKAIVEQENKSVISKEQHEELVGFKKVLPKILLERKMNILNCGFSAFRIFRILSGNFSIEMRRLYEDHPDSKISYMKHAFSVIHLAGVQFILDLTLEQFKILKDKEGRSKPLGVVLIPARIAYEEVNDNSCYFFNFQDLGRVENYPVLFKEGCTVEFRGYITYFKYGVPLLIIDKHLWRENKVFINYAKNDIDPRIAMFARKAKKNFSGYGENHQVRLKKKSSSSISKFLLNRNEQKYGTAISGYFFDGSEIEIENQQERIINCLSSKDSLENIMLVSGSSAINATQSYRRFETTIRNMEQETGYRFLINQEIINQSIETLNRVVILKKSASDGRVVIGQGEKTTKFFEHKSEYYLEFIKQGVICRVYFLENIEDIKLTLALDSLSGKIINSFSKTITKSEFVKMMSACKRLTLKHFPTKSNGRIEFARKKWVKLGKWEYGYVDVEIGQISEKDGVKNGRIIKVVNEDTREEELFYLIVNRKTEILEDSFYSEIPETILKGLFYRAVRQYILKENGEVRLGGKVYAQFSRDAGSEIEIRITNGEPDSVIFIKDKEGNPVLDIQGKPLEYDLKKDIRKQSREKDPRVIVVKAKSIRERKEKISHSDKEEQKEHLSSRQDKFSALNELLRQEGIPQDICTAVSYAVCPKIVDSKKIKAKLCFFQKYGLLTSEECRLIVRRKNVEWQRFSRMIAKEHIKLTSSFWQFTVKQIESILKRGFSEQGVRDLAFKYQQYDLTKSEIVQSMRAQDPDKWLRRKILPRVRGCENRNIFRQHLENKIGAFFCLAERDKIINELVEFITGKKWTQRQTIAQKLDRLVKYKIITTKKKKILLDIENYTLKVFIVKFKPQEVSENIKRSMLLYLGTSLENSLFTSREAAFLVARGYLYSRFKNIMSDYSLNKTELLMIINIYSNPESILGKLKPQNIDYLCRKIKLPAYFIKQILIKRGSNVVDGYLENLAEEIRGLIKVYSIPEYVACQWYIRGNNAESFKEKVFKLSQKEGLPVILTYRLFFERELTPKRIDRDIVALSKLCLRILKDKKAAYHKMNESLAALEERIFQDINCMQIAVIRKKSTDWQKHVRMPRY